MFRISEDGVVFNPRRDTQIVRERGHEADNGIGNTTGRGDFEIARAGQRFHGGVERAGGGVAGEIDGHDDGYSQGNRENGERGADRLAEERANHQAVEEAEAGHVRGASAGRSGTRDLLNLAIAQADDDVGNGRGFHAMRGHYGGCVLLASETIQQREYDVAGGGVEVTGGLVGQQQRRRMDQRAGDGHALHLAAGELMRQAVAQGVEFDPGEALARDCAGVGVAGKKQREFDIFEGRQGVKQLERLEDEANLGAADFGERSIVEARGGNAVKLNLAEGGEIHGAGKIEQRGLAAATAADQCDKRAALDLKRNAIEGADGLAIGEIFPGDVAQRENGHEGTSLYEGPQEENAAGAKLERATRSSLLVRLCRVFARRSITTLQTSAGDIMNTLFRMRSILVLGLFAMAALPVWAQNGPPGAPNPAAAPKLDLATQAHLSYPGDVTGYMDVTYSVVRGYRPLKLDLYVPASGAARPAVVWIHGGGWAGGSPRAALGPYPDWRVVLASLAARGYVVVGATYRFSGEAKFPAAIEDIKASVRWLRTNAAAIGVDPNRIGVWGESAGGQLASLLGTSCGAVELEGVKDPPVSSCVQAVADWYGPSTTFVARWTRS